MSRFRPAKPSPALVVATVALVMALGGTSYAAIKIGTKNIKNGAVTTKKLHNGAVTNNKLANGAVTASKINPSGLSVSNANSLGGIPASGYTRNDCNSLTGQIKGFALVSASPTFSSTLTTSGVFGYNCSGGAVEARRLATGDYEVHFLNNPAIIAVGNEDEPSGTSIDEDTVSFRNFSGGDFEAQILNIFSFGNADDQFDMILP